MRRVAQSILLLLALYGLVFAVGDFYLARHGASTWVACLFSFVFVGAQYLCGPWLIDLVLRIRWEGQGAALPDANREFLVSLCEKRGLKLPRIGIIESGTPNAFAFGRVRSDARVVVTTGLLQVLTPEEVNAVLAHEIGHIEHYDFALMTLASIVPLLLYQLYVFTRTVRIAEAVADAAYSAYVLSQLLVLFLSRTREYYADQFSAEVTQAPGALASALLKIGYGLVQTEGEYQRMTTRGDWKEKKHAAREQRVGAVIGAMGICNAFSNRALALTGPDSAAAAAAMRWDVVSPWARVYQIASTHPTTALRIRALARLAEASGQPPVIAPAPGEPIHWGMFPIYFLIWLAPWLTSLALLQSRALRYLFPNLSPFDLAVLAGLTACLWIVRISCRYRGAVRPASVSDLVSDASVSDMEPRAVRLEGEIVGRGVPGIFSSPDFVIRDQTGILFVRYHSLNPLARLMFAATELEHYIGQKVILEGWLRRGHSPYIEMSSLTPEDGRRHTVYSRWVHYLLALIASAVMYWIARLNQA